MRCCNSVYLQFTHMRMHTFTRAIRARTSIYLFIDLAYGGDIRGGGLHQCGDMKRGGRTIAAEDSANFRQ
jgi:hypothetical protein